MSMNFETPLTDEQACRMQELFSVVAHDKKTFLLNDAEFNRKDGSEIARMTNQIAELELNHTGEVKTLSDGTRYELAKSGWKKV